jgi:predicted DNA-binding transcriptional regulator AlpA
MEREVTRKRPRGRRITRAADLAAALGLQKSRVYELIKLPWFPAKDKDGWALTDVLAAVTRNTAARRVVVPEERQPAVDYPDASGLPDLEDPLDIATAAVRVAAVEVARSQADGGNVAKDLGALTGTLKELRSTEAGLLDLRERKGLLIPTSRAAARAGELGAILVSTLERLEDDVAAKVVELIEDADFLAGTTAERRRYVSEWMRSECRSARDSAAKAGEDLADE